MTTQLPSKERLEWLLTSPGQPGRAESDTIIRALLAGMEQAPVGVFNIGNEFCEDYLVAWTVTGQNLPVGVYWLYTHPAPELTAIIDRLNLSGYEHEDGEVTPQNAAAVVDILLQQLDEAVQGRDTHPAPSIPACVQCSGTGRMHEPGEELGDCALCHGTGKAIEPSTPAGPDDKQVDELTMWVKRLAYSLKKANPGSKLHSDAMDYLSRKGLIGVGDILR